MARKTRKKSAAKTKKKAKKKSAALASKKRKAVAKSKTAARKKPARKAKSKTKPKGVVATIVADVKAFVDTLTDAERLHQKLEPRGSPESEG